MARPRKNPDEKAPKIARDIGRTVVLLRGDQKMSRETLAELADSHPATLGFFERGESSPTIETLELIAKGLGIKTSELIKKAGH